MTNGGGAGVMAADAAALAGVDLPPLSEALRRRLDAVLPPTWSRGNPIDIIGDAPVERYTATLRALLDEPAAGTVLFMHAPTAIVRSDDIARACAPLAREAAGRLMGCWLGDAGVAEARRIFEEAGVAGYETPEEAVRAFAMLASYQRNQALLTEAPTASEAAPPDSAAARAIVESAVGAGREMLDELEAKAVLQAYGIPVVPTVAVDPTAGAAVEAARSTGYPVALKILSPDISHKSDVGGVVLGLRDDDAVRVAVEEMLARVRSLRPAARLSGFTVQAMVRRPHAQELIVGASVDPVFGPVILFGQGGTAVEVIADRAIGLPPLNHVLARDLVAATRVARLLAGYRDHPPARMEAICDVLVAVSQMLADLPELAELDINPLLADGDGVIALDGRLRVARASVPGTSRFAIQPYPAELAETWVWHGPGAAGAADPTGRRSPASSLRHAARPGGRAPALFSIRRELPRSELARLVQIDYDARWPSLPSRRSPTARCGRSASCAPSSTRTTSRPSSRSFSAPMPGAGTRQTPASQDGPLSAGQGTQRSSPWCCARTRPCGSWPGAAASSSTRQVQTTGRCAWYWS
jgi:acetyltransferase